MSGKEQVKGDLIAGFRDQKLASSVVPCPDELPDLVVSKVTFHGNRVIERDTEGDFSELEWDMQRSADEQSPVCYVRGETPTVTVEFLVLGTRSYSGSVTIHGGARFGDQDVEWSQDVTLVPGDPTVTITQVAASAPLPDQVACYDPVTITWEARPPGKARSPAGTTQHVLYALLAAPTTVLHWTLVDISCRWGHGATDEATLVDRVFPAFKTKKLTRKRDGRGLSYWVPETPRVLAQNAQCTAVNTWGLLHSKHGRGQCGSWSELLLDTFQVHGLVGNKIEIKPSWFVPAPGNPNAKSFILVKSWWYVVPPPTSPVAFTHVMFSQCVELPGVSGQRNANPPGIFENHFIARVLGKLYDPSYGVGPLSGNGPTETQHVWESGALDGLMTSAMTPARGGYAKSPDLVTKLTDRAPSPAYRTADETD